MDTALIASDGIAQFKTGVDALLQKRDYFIQKILPKLVENRDYYTIKGRKSLGKAGAEKLATIYSLVATFTKDTDAIESFRSIEGLCAYVCTLTRSGQVMGQGRGAAVLKSHGNDCNKTVKMAQKSAFIDAVIRATGLSDIFTSDLEDMPVASIQEERVETPSSYFPKNQAEVEDELITEKQKTLLTSLIFERIGNEDERERWLSEAQGLSKFDASEMISSFLMASRR